MSDDFEPYWNEMVADLVVFRITQSLMIRLIGANPATAEDGLQGLKNSVLGAIGRIETGPDHGSERMQQLMALRAEKLFLEIEEAASGVRNWLGQTG